MAFFSLKESLAKAQEKWSGLGKRVTESAALELWPSVVGPQIAKHARAIWVREEKHLVVEVDHPVWRTELTHRAPQLLERLAAAGVKLDTIEFQDRTGLLARGARSAARWIKSAPPRS